MFAFWALTALVAYGCFHGGGLVHQFDRWLGDKNQTYVPSFPLLKTLNTSTVITLGIFAVAGFCIHRILSRPRIANTLRDAEGEIAKVTWPTWAEAWQGTIAVLVMVGVLFLFLTLADLLLIKVMDMLIGGGS
jgi:preprotein translocase SecE subunit